MADHLAGRTKDSRMVDYNSLDIDQLREKKKNKERRKENSQYKQNKPNTISHRALLPHLHDHEWISYTAYISEGGVEHDTLRSKGNPCRP